MYNEVCAFERRRAMQERNDTILRKLVESLCGAYHTGVLKKDVVVDRAIFNGMCCKSGGRQ